MADGADKEVRKPPTTWKNRRPDRTKTRSAPLADGFSAFPVELKGNGLHSCGMSWLSRVPFIILGQGSLALVSGVRPEAQGVSITAEAAFPILLDVQAVFAAPIIGRFGRELT
jgi:hypothetical protein